jgi:hypothetical protein
MRTNSITVTARELTLPMTLEAHTQRIPEFLLHDL